MVDRARTHHRRRSSEATHYARRCYERSSRQLSSAYHRKLTDSALELLIAVPSHIIVNRRHDCTAPFVSSFGVATGLAMLLMSIGPGVLFLYRARMRRIGAARRTSGALMSPVALLARRLRCSTMIVGQRAQLPQQVRLERRSEAQR